MFHKRDLTFLETLADESKLQIRLKELSLTRRISASAAIFALVSFFVLFFMEILVFKAGGRTFPGTVLMLAISIQSAISAILAHCEIRSFLLYRKLREMNES